MHVWQAERVVQLLALPAKGIVLDLATGTGLAARSLVRATGGSVRVVGVDLSAGMLAAARQESRGLPCAYVRCDAGVLPFSAGVFDALVCVAAVPYLPDLDPAFAEWRRVGRSGAELVFTVPAADGTDGLRQLRAAAAEHGVVVEDPHARLGSKEAVRAAAAHWPLAVVDVVADRFAEPVGGDPRQSFDTIIAYRFAEPVRELRAETREAVFRAYERRHLAMHERGDGGHEVLFVRCRMT